MTTHAEGRIDPEQEALLADSVGLALLVVLDILSPAERLAFVLHDIFAVPFDEIAPIVERMPAAARQLASRARRRVRAGAWETSADLRSQREVVEAFLTASRAGNFDALLSVLDPNVVFRDNLRAAAASAPGEVRGAQAIAKQFMGGAQVARPVLVNGSWKVDETYIKVKKQWVYLYRTVDSQENTIEVLLSPTRDAEATTRFHCKALHVTVVDSLDSVR